MMLLKDKIALITGSSRGIGAATARLFAKHGADVVINYVKNEDTARHILAEIEKEGGKAILIQADVTDQEQVEQMVRETESKLGFIDILVSNAGIEFPVVPFLDFKWEDFSAKLNGEIKAAFFCCKSVVPSMVERKSGCILAVSSMASRIAAEGFIAHSTAKSALDAFVKSLAHELGPHGIRVNAVGPGLIVTDATAFIPEEYKQFIASNTPLRRNGMPGDVAGALLMLASDETKFVSGAYLPVTGGSFMV
jgi:3-oxoacyl-[acyl-carrier protein] reductase